MKHVEEWEGPVRSWLSSADDHTVHLVGVGNLIRRDDGVGLEVVSKLRKALGPRPTPKLRIHAPSLNPERIMSRVASKGDSLIVFDAVEANKRPGSIVCASLDDTKFGFFATHNIPLKLVPGVSESLDKMHVVGIQPESVDVGEGLSDIVRMASDRLVATITDIERGCG
jgi:hydrogenase 3 maturation protease